MLVAIFLGLWQWYDKRARSTELDEVDRNFFRRQDFRRWVGIGVMLILAAAIAVEPFITARIRGHPRRRCGILAIDLFVVCVLILVLLALAISPTDGDDALCPPSPRRAAASSVS